MTLKELLKERLHGVLDPMMETEARKSTLEGGPKIGDEEEPSITRYLIGSLYDKWAGSDKERVLYEEAKKAMSSDTLLTGGVLVHPQIQAQIIPLLRAKLVTGKLGMQVVNLPSTNALSMPKIASGTTAYWVGENDSKTESELTFGGIDLKLKEVAGLVKVPNNLIADSMPAADAIVKDDLSTVLALAEDLAIIQGVGGLQPLGLYNWPAIPSTTLTAAITSDDLLDAISTIEQSNGEYDSWLMHPRSKNTIRQLKNAIGDYVWMMGDITKEQPDRLLGLPCYYTTQIPITLTFGAITSASYIIVGSWKRYVKIQKQNGISMDVSTEAGTAFQYDQTWFRATRRLDGGPRHIEDFNIIKGVA